jgi:CRP-like cAMP-binding protein
MTYLDFTGKDFYVAVKHLLLDKGKRREMKKGDFLCRIGERPVQFGLLTSGSLKYCCHTTSGHERIISFAFTGDLVGSYSSMRNCVPSPLDIVALESSTIYQMPVVEVDAAIGLDMRIRLSEAVAHKALLEAVDNCRLTPEERYLELSNRFPDIHNRLTNRAIASYLGITPESLCRLCKRLLTS